MSILLALAALALGWLALGLLGVRLRAAERWPAAFAVGMPLLAAWILLLTTAHLYRRSLLVGSAVALMALAAWRRRSILVEGAAPLSRPLLALCVIVLAAVSAWTAYAALGPDTTPPGHDDAIAAAAQIHRGTLKPRWDETALWSAAFEVGGHTGVALLHACFLPALALTLLALLRRLSTPLAAVLAALLLATAPALGAFASQAGIQLVWLLCVFSALWLAHLAGESDQPRLLAAVVLLAVFSAKLNLDSAGVFGGYIFGWLPWQATLPLAAALGWTLQRQPLSLAALLVFQIVTALPPLTPRPQPSNHAPAALVEADAPPKSLILAERPIARAWTTRRVTTAPDLLRILQSSWDEALRPSRQRTLPVTDTPRRTFFVERDGLIAEVRFFRKDAELARAPTWRVRSLAGESAATLAFDNSLVTACDCAIEIDFGAAERFDEVRIAGTHGEPVNVPPGLRRAATLELKRRGVTHVLVWEGGALFGELRRNGPYWGAHEIGGRNAAHLFALD